ncbi:MAG: methyltransferase domain-containing protein [Rhizomicrobium sp.]
MAPDGDPLAAAQSLMEEGRPAEAATALRALLDAGRGGLLSRTMLVSALVASDQTGEAVAIARETALTNPQAAIAAVSLGEALLAAGSLATAIGEFQRALRLDSDSARARFLLGRAWLEAGESEKALEAFEAVSDETPELAAAVVEARDMCARPRADPRYVRHLFDEFSGDYDSRMLQQLGYNAPQVLREMAAMLGVVEPRSILDLGCGTGLAGLAFGDIASTLVGIDLSPAMIEKARARSIYTELLVCDLEAALSIDGPSFDLILAADTLVYLGDLRGVFAGAARTLSPGGTFLFTLEKSETVSFELGPKRRWRHSEAYVRDETACAGLDVTGLLACHPRSEAGVPVEGLAVALGRPA